MTAIDVSAPRIAAVDALRGVAIAAMIVYHFSWDLSYFGFISVNVTADPGWIAFARLIAGTFVAMVGVSLVLATRRGLRPRPYLRRLAVIVGAAVVVTLGTRFVFPEAYVFFGILHLIAFASVAALPFLWLPTPVVLLTAVAVFVLPFVFNDELFSYPLLWWVGLAPRKPISVDYIPVFPWFAVTLFGIAAGRLIVRYAGDSPLTRWSPRHFLGHAAIFAGRWSLLIYLIHQLVLFNLVWAAAEILLPDPRRLADSFMQECVPTCRTTGHAPPVCEAYCGCVLSGIQQAGYLESALVGRMTAEQNNHWLELVDRCSPSAADLSPQPDPTSPQ